MAGNSSENGCQLNSKDENDLKTTGLSLHVIPRQLGILTGSEDGWLLNA